MEVSGAQMIFGLVLGVAILIFLVLKTKIHAFLALIIAASITGLVGGMSAPDVVNTITAGFGSTLGSIGIVIGFGVMMGRILEVSGAAEKMAYTLVKWVGKRKEEWAMAITGYIVSIPIFVDSAFVILTPLVKALSKKTGKSVLTIGVALGAGLVATHHAVPPTPGPLGVAGIFGVDVGLMIAWGLVFAIPVIIVGVLYAKWLGTKIYQIPDETGLNYIRPVQPVTLQEFLESKEKKDLPSLTRSVLPIFVPILLIFANTTISALELKGGIYDYITFIGSPVIAVGIGLIFSIYGLYNHVKRSEALDHMEEGIKTSGIILLVTGAGGALGNVLRESGSGDYIAQQVAQWHLPAILIPFIIATIVRLIQGSGTVAMITAASISAPILQQLDVNMALAAQAAALGAMIFSYFNDSLFWVINRMLGIKEVKEQILTWSIPTTLAWAVSLIMLLIVNAFFG
ncbi:MULTISPECIES: GntP family permease [Geobacillus]|uniref:Gluconate:H+ symporter n=1 Tax=Geobacillus thermodenitrificans TaxID=33940 RepID=A0ABY9QB03_GEOTD|nr:MULTISPECIES: gluconate:H+ symporter [Geobacillus]MEC5188052.1 GntP family gluconate:H+ symporter [Geobacillus thermodenitrificans]MED0663275.1 gluconate permease [Geobacillus thermodenitrificans]OQP08455.1 gluconate permease [Geobacillus sp. 47C-IIb]QNU32715.1 GntP family permease [Geobacillus sp. 47C-IIb]WMV76084.1 gluconate:H+ symporter [Geobacillus thermodenitrificans]